MLFPALNLLCYQVQKKQNPYIKTEKKIPHNGVGELKAIRVGRVIVVWSKYITWLP